MSKRVLVVDDSELQRMIIVSALSEFDFDIVGEAENGIEAVEKAAGLTP